MFYPFTYSPDFVTDSISGKDYWMFIPLFLPMFFFNSLNLGMTGVTIVTSSANMRSPLVTVYTFPVL
ncbi:MAG: hypothetical protein ACTHME_00290 [Candidatus Nitrosocosmicus sp.]